MLVPILLLGAAAVATYLVVKSQSSDDKQPMVPPTPRPPPGVINMGLQQGMFVAGYFVRWGDGIDEAAHGVFFFQTQAQAEEYFLELDAFFASSYPDFVCSSASAFGVVFVVDHSSFPVALLEFTCAQYMRWKMPSGPALVDRARDTIPSPTSSVMSTQTKPIYAVLTLVNAGLNLFESHFFDTEADANAYYDLLFQFFSQQPVRVAYTWPTGNVSITKYGSTGNTRFAMWNEYGSVGEVT